VALGEGSDPGAIEPTDLASRITEQGEGKALFGTEGGVGIGPVCTDPNDLGMGCLESLQVPLKAAGFQGAATREIPRIKIKNKPTTQKIAQG
jgi:hypothetical protein